MSRIIASQKKAIENCHVSRAIDPRTKFPWLVKLLQTEKAAFSTAISKLDVNYTTASHYNKRKVAEDQPNRISYRVFFVNRSSSFSR